MAQLSKDGFSSVSSSMTIEEAVELINGRLPVTAASEIVELARAEDRIATDDVFALNDLPPFANSAVDGYAVRYQDLETGTDTRLPIGGRLTAGEVEPVQAAGHAVRIFTGAAMPRDADTVFMQEDVEVSKGAVTLPPGLKRGSNMRPAGEDATRGARIIEAGRRLRPQDLALAAATGHRHITVRRPLRVAIFSTGNELVESGGLLGPGAIYDSNRIMLTALLTRLRLEVSDFGILRDNKDVLAERLAMAAEENDVILSSGGVSLGEEDHVKAAVEAVGQLVFWRLAIKPGRPLAMGMVKGTPFVGLPGNPVAVYVTFLFVVRPLLAHLGGAKAEKMMPLRVRSTFNAKKKPGRREFIRISVSRAADGVLEAHKFPKEGAALLTSLTTSDGLAELADDATGVAAGDIINFYSHDAF